MFDIFGVLRNLTINGDTHILRENNALITILSDVLDGIPSLDIFLHYKKLAISIPIKDIFDITWKHSY